MKNNLNKLKEFIFIVALIINYVTYVMKNPTVVNVILCIVISLINSYIIYFIIKMIYNKTIKDKVNMDYLKKDLNYFRDILKGYDPAEISYINSFDISYPKDIVAMLLSLQNKGKILLKKDTKEIIINDDGLPLTKGEEYILSCISNNKVNNYDYFTFLSIIQESVYNKGLLIKRNKNDFKVFLGMFAFSLVFVIIFSFRFIYNNSIVMLVLFAIMFLIFTGLCFYSFIYLFIILVLNPNPYIKSELGEDIFNRLEGLKKYLKEFSSIDEKSVEELAIWDEYLIYSVIFNQNQNIIKEIEDIYL